MADPDSILLKLENLSVTFKEGHPLFSGVNLTVNRGDIVAIVGKSGGGKTTLLKCIAHMGVYSGRVLLHGQKPQEYGIPNFRTKVLYVPQRPSMLPSTPRVFLRRIEGYAARKEDKDNEQAAIELGQQWSLEDDIWDRPWTSLSGGEAQRTFLAIACTLKNTEVLLLDEPTSALDADTVKTVETHLCSLPASSHSSIQAIIWITHSDDQAHRATRLIRVANGGATEDSIPEGV
ncbi:hypothetical protein FRB94_009427 [Tulasnella sp. JGI-2019a]|nr:hypothetical protein FRB93_006472 [Tulasnella sp. JGI-2019a]KAG9010947.1 hypothetical protein FRB94_009427 [Tulasnella sp. JGI-2019a]KAG9038419.1 hypothetical protein FRB95_001276 [Tulasnella sp. JGI-2019a]